LDDAQLQSAYHQMALIRAFELRLNELFLQGLVAGTTHLCVGQEACSVGVGMALKNEDAVFSNHRGHGHLIAKGGDPARLMAEIFGLPYGYSGGRGGSQHCAVKDCNFLGTHGITAGTIPLATGVALHKKRMDEPGVALVFFGDGGTGEGIFHESLNMAALWKLPVFFICENNQYAMSSAHRDFSPVDSVTQRAAAYGIHAESIDGNDVEAVYASVCEHRKRMVADSAPVLLELMTYRISGHSRGDQCVYRSREEEAEARQLDPLERTRARLGWDHERQAEHEAAIDAEIADIEARARGGAARA
jgi:acetoin:2,6-dichlorophenolindophenol oxidoreductase subunit alpha